jgi:tetratricopeptide (TPR) repeat protein
MVLQAWEQWQAAADVYQRAEGLAPKAFEWPYLAAFVTMRMGRAADALTPLERALTLAPSYLPARLKQAEALLDAGDLTRSAQLYAALASEPAAQPEAEYGLGRLAALERRWPDAIVHHRRACELFPEFGAAHYALALAYRNVGRMDEAQRELELHRRFGPRWPGVADPVLARMHALRDDARAHLERGITLGNEGRIDEAIAEHLVALTRDPANAQAHANLISLYARQKSWAKVDEHFKAVVALRSNLDEAYFNYGVALGLQQRHAEAAEAFRQAVAINPAHAQAHINLGVLLERDRKWDEAAAAYRRAVESQPALRLARFNLARMLIAAGRNDEAIAELERVRTPEDKESPHYVFALATAHLRAGRRDLGVQYAHEARRLALAYGQPELAAAIDKDLAAIGSR